MAVPQIILEKPLVVSDAPAGKAVVELFMEGPTLKAAFSARGARGEELPLTEEPATGALAAIRTALEKDFYYQGGISPGNYQPWKVSDDSNPTAPVEDAAALLEKDGYHHAEVKDTLVHRNYSKQLEDDLIAVVRATQQGATAEVELTVKRGGKPQLAGQHPAVERTRRELQTALLDAGMVPSHDAQMGEIGVDREYYRFADGRQDDIAFRSTLKTAIGRLEYQEKPATQTRVYRMQQRESGPIELTDV